MTLIYIDDAKTAKNAYKLLPKEIVFNKQSPNIGRNKDPVTKKVTFDALDLSGNHATLLPNGIIDSSTNGTYLYLINGDSLNTAQPRPLDIEINPNPAIKRNVTVGDLMISLAFTS